ncbi:DEAD/DEAH box helicase [Clostridium sp. NSJ-145]|uniref:DEAD/DEAH box helicase n=1 Tax=Clostridium sp. NSJ-145 TaxID=2897777 RepID=UPI001E31DDB2|nr:DEAD/DEAH box helicase [Clostridium sp. NSJ-145]MCD2501049.1 DEAD/DEAH box helicase [Clostridium sp. NSJ-145]
MNYKRLEENILRSCSGLTRKKGNELILNKAVKSIQGKKVDGVYHIYGKLENDNKVINTHLKYDLNKERLCGYKCTCSKYKDYLEQGYSYYCEHIAATSLRFLDSLKSKIKDSKENSQSVPKKDVREILHIESKIYYYKVNNLNQFFLELKVGNKSKYLISNIKEFIYSVFNDKEIKLTDTFKYSPLKHKINESDLKYLDYIKGNILNNSTNGAKIKIEQKQLPLLLGKIPNEEILFKDIYLEYKTKINKGTIDIAFNLKEENGQFVLWSEKNLPVPLDNEKRVFLFNREIYLLKKEISKAFIPIYNELKKNNFKYFPGNNQSFINIISTLSSITKKVNVSDDLRNYMRKFLMGKYFIYKEKDNIFCDIKVIYGDKVINVLKDNKVKLGWIRDLKYEERVIMTFERYGFIKNNARMKFVGDDEKLYSFLHSRENELLTSGEIIIPKDLNEFNVYTSKDLYGTVYEEDWAIKLSYGIKDITQEEFKEAYLAFKNNKNFYKTKKNNFIDLLDDKIRELFNMINLLNLEKDLDKGISYINKSKSSLVQGIINKCDLSFIYNNGSLKSVEDKLEALKSKEIKISKMLMSILRPYQYEGVKWIDNLYELDFGGILADDMGLGKTLQTIAFLSMKKKEKFLIIVPTSLIFNWRDEFLKFAPSLKVGIVYGDKRDDVLKDYKKFNGLITTYGILKNDLDKFIDKEFDICIIDEAQNIKNYKSQNAESVKKIKSKFKLALTGTPIENSLKELWSIFDFVMPGFLYSTKEFESKFSKDDEKSMMLLKTLINPFILRRTKEEVAKDLPGKSEKRIIVELDENQRFMYKNYLNNVREKIKTDSNIQVLSHLTRLRQICLHPALVFPEYIGNSGKFIIAHKLINTAIKNDRKILIFSQFTSVLDMFGAELEEDNIKFFKLSGDTLSKERIKLVNDFNNSDDVKVFLISLKAGGTGLNLTSANLVIHFDPWWNPAVESQASDRAHRIGQEKDVEVIKLIAKETIEESIVTLQEDKKELIQDILSGSNIKSSSINKKMIQELIETYIEK